MKKKIRFLPLLLSLLLLCATAFPASAVCYGPEEYLAGFPDETRTATSGYASNGQYYATVTTSPRALSSDYRRIIPEVNGIHDGSETYISEVVGDMAVVFRGNQNFAQGTYYNVMTAAGEDACVAYEVFNETEYLEYCIPSGVPKTEYRLYAYCNYGYVSVSVYSSGNAFQTSQTIAEMPYTDGVFFYLDY